MTPHQRLVTKYVNKWRYLSAWGKSMDHVKIEVSSRQYPKRAGACWTREQRIEIYHQPGLRGAAAMLKTGLHEMAHAVETSDGHGYKWQERYASVIREVTGESIPWGFKQHSTVDEEAYCAVLRWWRRSGAEAEAIGMGIIK